VKWQKKDGTLLRKKNRGQVFDYKVLNLEQTIHPPKSLRGGVGEIKKRVLAMPHRCIIALDPLSNLDDISFFVRFNHYIVPSGKKFLVLAWSIGLSFPVRQIYNGHFAAFGTNYLLRLHACPLSL
jgi:hypothetical protein